MKISDKLIITAAITGAETLKRDQPNLPITPDEQAIAAKACVEAGASVIHLHVREDDGSPSQRTERFQESIEKIRSAAPGVIIQISTGGAVGESLSNRLKPLGLRPEMASLNLGSVNFGNDVFVNTPTDIESFGLKMKELSIVPELEVYEAGMVEMIPYYEKKGILGSHHHVQFVLGVRGGMSGDLRNLLHMISLLPENSTWGVAGIGRFQLPLAVHAILLGGNVRVGFEDNIYERKGVIAKSNADLVSRIVRLSREVGRQIASPDEARLALLGH